MFEAKMSRRELLKALGAAAAGSVLAACAPQPETVTVRETVVVEVEGEVEVREVEKLVTVEVAPQDDLVELTWLSHTYEPWNNALAAQGMQYMNENPNVKIVYSYITHADLNTKIVTSLAAGDPFDIMGVYGPWMPQFIDGGHPASAPDDVIEDLDANFPPMMKDAAAYDGKVYAYVQHIGIPTPIINVGMYADAGAAEPDTYDELLAAQDLLDKKDSAGNWEQFGCTLSASKGGSWNVIHYSAILFSFGGSFLDSDLKQATFNSPEGIEAANIYKRLTHIEAPDSAFNIGKSAMVWNGPWIRSELDEQAPDVDYKAIRPLEGPAGRAIGSYVWFWAVSSLTTSEETRAAWDFTGWLSAAEQYADIYRNAGLFPITNELPEEFADDPWAQAYNETLQYGRVYYAKHEKWEQIDVAIGEEMERFAAGEVEAEEFLATAEEKVNRLLG